MNMKKNNENKKKEAIKESKPTKMEREKNQ